MEKQKLYTVAEFATSGWAAVDENSVHLTREQAKTRIEELIEEGYNPNRLKAILE